MLWGQCTRVAARGMGVQCIRDRHTSGVFWGGWERFGACTRLKRYPASFVGPAGWLALGRLVHHGGASFVKKCGIVVRVDILWFCERVLWRRGRGDLGCRLFRFFGGAVNEIVRFARR